jgi:hypothetical protein
MLRSILVIGLTFVLIDIGQMGSGLIHMLLAGDVDIGHSAFLSAFLQGRRPIPGFLHQHDLAFFDSILMKEG